MHNNIFYNVVYIAFKAESVGAIKINSNTLDKISINIDGVNQDIYSIQNSSSLLDAIRWIVDAMHKKQVEIIKRRIKMRVPELTKKLIIEILENNNGQYDFSEDQIDDIADCYLRDEPADGFEFMQSLTGRKYYWSGDFNTAESLNEVIDIIEDEYNRALNEWVIENNIKPKYKEGDRVRGSDWIVKGLSKNKAYTYDLYKDKGSKWFIQVRCDKIDNEIEENKGEVK